MDGSQGLDRLLLFDIVSPVVLTGMFANSAPAIRVVVQLAEGRSDVEVEIDTFLDGLGVLWAFPDAVGSILFRSLSLGLLSELDSSESSMVGVDTSTPDIRFERRISVVDIIDVETGVVADVPGRRASSSFNRRDISLLSCSSCAARFFSMASSRARDLCEAANCLVLTDLLVELPVDEEKFVRQDFLLA